MFGSTVVRLATFALVASTGLAAWGEEPRYAFRVGEELVYEQTASVDRLAAPASYAANQPLDRLVRFVVTPVRENPDGSWRLLIQTTVRLFRFREHERPRFRSWNEHLGYVDLFLDGTYSANPSTGFSYLFYTVPEVLFPPLPRGAGLAGPTAATEQVYALSSLSSCNGVTHFGGRITKATDARFNNHVSLLVEFDETASRPTRLVRTSAGGDPGDWFHTATTIELIKTQQRTPDWVARYEAAANRYFAARAEHGVTWSDGEAWGDAATSDDPVACRRLLDTRLARVRVARAAEPFADMRPLYDGVIALHREESEIVVQDAAKRRALYDRPPMAWESVDLDDEPSYYQEGLFGHVVVLDFWYRGCPSCIKALPALKRVHKRFADQPVVVLGVNNDRDPKDAYHVIEAYAIPYPTIRNELPEPVGEHGRISTAYGVNIWPTFIVLGTDGRVAALLSGNTHQLESDLTAAIEQALATSR